MIPLLKSESFLNERLLLEIADFHGLTTKELKDLIDDFENPRNLNKRSEGYLTVRLGNRVSCLTAANWLILKEAYIRWKLYEEMEFEKDVTDKKKELDNLIKGIREDNINTVGKKKVSGIIVF
jgi:hypothetical protein